MQSHHGLHGIGNSHTTSNQAQFGRLWFPVLSDSIKFYTVAADEDRLTLDALRSYHA
jgi:hypothetical protein